MGRDINTEFSYTNQLIYVELKRIKNKNPQELQTIRVSRLKKICNDVKKLINKNNDLIKKLKNIKGAK